VIALPSWTRKIIALDKPQELVHQLLAGGFTKERIERHANLEDVFLNLTGHLLVASECPVI